MLRRGLPARLARGVPSPAQCANQHRHCRRLRAGQLSAIQHAENGAVGQRRIAGDPRPGSLSADALTYQPRQPDEPGSHLSRRTGQGLALGRVGSVAGRTHPGRHQGDLRPDGRSEVDGRICGDLIAGTCPSTPSKNLIRS